MLNDDELQFPDVDDDDLEEFTPQRLKEELVKLMLRLLICFAEMQPLLVLLHLQVSMCCGTP